MFIFIIIVCTGLVSAMQCGDGQCHEVERNFHSSNYCIEDCETGELDAVCLISKDCNEGLKCDGNYCVVDDFVGSGVENVAGESSSYCLSDLDCDEGLLCGEDGTCMYAELVGEISCDDFSDCDVGYVCISGYCREDLRGGDVIIGAESNWYALKGANEWLQEKVTLGDNAKATLLEEQQRERVRELNQLEGLCNDGLDESKCAQSLVKFQGSVNALADRGNQLLARDNALQGIDTTRLGNSLDAVSLNANRRVVDMATGFKTSQASQVLDEVAKNYEDAISGVRAGGRSNLVALQLRTETISAVRAAAIDRGIVSDARSGTLAERGLIDTDPATRIGLAGGTLTRTPTAAQLAERDAVVAAATERPTIDRAAFAARTTTSGTTSTATRTTTAARTTTGGTTSTATRTTTARTGTATARTAAARTATARTGTAAASTTRTGVRSLLGRVTGNFVYDFLFFREE